MKLYRQTLALLLAATFITVECAAAKTIRVDTPRTQMTVRQARKSLVEALGHLRHIKSVREVKFNRHRITFVADDTYFDGTFHANDVRKPRDFSVSFAGMKNLSVESSSKFGWHLIRLNGKDMVPLDHDPAGWYAMFGTEPAAMTFVDAVLTLKEAEFAPDTEEADFAAFTANAKTWFAATSKPEMSEEARTYKVLAEDAFKRKDFTAALDSYCDALEKHPMWPSGQYNTALLAAEAEDYELAAQHMRRYLVLSPDAKDAQAAKDKLLLWQHKAKE